MADKQNDKPKAQAAPKSEESPVTVEEVNEDAAAQVAPPRDPDADKVRVNEVRVSVDTVITDPSSPLAVQVPEQDDAESPIHALKGDSPEDAFKKS